MNLRYLVEVALGASVSDQEFERAAVKARNKQARIYNSTKRQEVKDIAYLAQLVKEAIVEAELMEFCSVACEVLHG